MTLPPPTRGLALALGGVSIVAAALAWAGLSALTAARADLAAHQAEARLGALPSAPLLGAGLLHVAPDRAAASAALLATLRAAAAQRRLLVERLTALPPSDAGAELGAEVTVSGPETDVFHFVRTVETARPALRFALWRVARTGPGETAIRLEARAVGYWEAR